MVTPALEGVSATSAVPREAEAFRVGPRAGVAPAVTAPGGLVFALDRDPRWTDPMAPARARRRAVAGLGAAPVAARRGG